MNNAASVGKSAAPTAAERIQAIYGAFGRGDIPAILEHLAEDVDWEYGLAPNGVPWLQRRRGRAGAAEFFQTLGALDFHKFVPKTILEGPGIAVSLVDIEVTIKATGRRVAEEDEVHVWHFGPDGLVKRFRHCVDTAQHVAAYRGEAVRG